MKRNLPYIQAIFKSTAILLAFSLSTCAVAPSAYATTSSSKPPEDIRSYIKASGNYSEEAMRTLAITSVLRAESGDKTAYEDMVENSPNGTITIGYTNKNIPLQLLNNTMDQEKMTWFLTDNDVTFETEPATIKQDIIENHRELPPYTINNLKTAVSRWKKLGMKVAYVGEVKMGGADIIATGYNFPENSIAANVASSPRTNDRSSSRHRFSQNIILLSPRAELSAQQIITNDLSKTPPEKREARRQELESIEDIVEAQKQVHISSAFHEIFHSLGGIHPINAVKKAASHYARKDPESLVGFLFQIIEKSGVKLFSNIIKYVPLSSTKTKYKNYAKPPTELDQLLIEALKGEEVLKGYEDKPEKWDYKPEPNNPMPEEATYKLREFNYSIQTQQPSQTK